MANEALFVFRFEDGTGAPGTSPMPAAPSRDKTTELLEKILERQGIQRTTPTEPPGTEPIEVPRQEAPAPRPVEEPPAPTATPMPAETPRPTQPEMPEDVAPTPYVAPEVDDDDDAWRDDLGGRARFEIEDEARETGQDFETLLEKYRTEASEPEPPEKPYDIEAEDITDMVLEPLESAQDYVRRMAGQKAAETADFYARQYQQGDDEAERLAMDAAKRAEELGADLSDAVKGVIAGRGEQTAAGAIAAMEAQAARLATATTAGGAAMGAVGAAMMPMVFAEQMNDLGMQIASAIKDVSPDVAVAQAELEARMLMQRIDIADRLGPELGRLIDASADIREGTAQLGAALAGPLMKDVADMRSGLGSFVKWVGDMAERNQETWDRLYPFLRDMSSLGRMFGGNAMAGQVLNKLFGDGERRSLGAIFDDHDFLTPKGWGDVEEMSPDTVEGLLLQ